MIKYPGLTMRCQRNSLGLSPSSVTTKGQKIREITEGEDLNECDREALQFIDNIQGAAGNVMFVAFPSLEIVAADLNISSISWITCTRENEQPSSLSSARGVNAVGGERNDSLLPLGSMLENVIPSPLCNDLVNSVLEMIRVKSKRSFQFYTHEGELYAITLSPENVECTIIAIEIEHQDKKNEGDCNFCSTLLSLSRIMEYYAEDYEQLASTACDSVFSLMKGMYNRGMVYRFNDDDSGQVIHEVKDDDVESSYLGLRFPAGDIPKNARDLYMKNGLRYIQDVDVQDIPIAAARAQPTIDLSHVRMRAVSIHHIRYLKNMGVKSSLSIAIVVENALWGLLAFHGYKQAFKPLLQQRIACETISSMLSVKIQAVMKQKESTRVINMSGILSSWKLEQECLANLNDLGTQILQVVEADVLVGRIQDTAKDVQETFLIGDASLAPTDESFWTEFSKHPKGKVLAVSTRAGLTKLGRVGDHCTAGGVVYYHDTLVELVLARRLRSRDVAWGGKPDAPKEKIHGKLAPRNSFAKYMEKARQESRAWSTADLNLVSTVAERISEHSSNRMMNHLRKDIEEANSKYFTAIERAQDNCEFFAQMSHEIRTPFHGVIGCLSLMRDAKSMSYDEMQDLVTTALSSGNHMINLLNDILDISKDSYGNSISKEKVNFQILAAEATQGLKSLALNNGITFNSMVYPGSADKNCTIMTDKTKVVQMVSNLISNAVKFSPKGSIDIQIRLEDTIEETVTTWERESTQHDAVICSFANYDILNTCEEVKNHVATLSKPSSDCQKWLMASIADSGCGIRPTELAEMLKPYTQSSRGSNRNFQGTGLGLFICASLCHQLNGFLAVASTVGKGSTFLISIPVGIPDSNALSKPSSTLEYKKASQPPPNSSKQIKLRGPILVVDDNKINVKILVRSLQSEFKKANLDSVEVLTADGGQAAFDLFKHHRPGLVFIDYHMPEVDGAQATEMMRRFEKEECTTDPSHIVSYTADATEKTAVFLMSRGANEIMIKPPPKGFLAAFVKRIELESYQEGPALKRKKVI